MFPLVKDVSGKNMTSQFKKLTEKIGQVLKQQGLKLATAESCTGGGLSYAITEISGSSTWFERGFVTYSDKAKMEMLSVSEQTLKRHGAVSQEVAKEMAEGALKNSLADVSIAITGIAGPTGGTAEKPVGLVFIAWSAKHFKTVVEVYRFLGNRQAIREQAIQQALEKLVAW
jgi:nicotinamide-nucleotide amidase